MAVVEPYAPCPCGSGEKFKWCCHKVEAFAERAERLYDNGQVEAALGVLDEGLRKSPDNPWLSVRKAIILTRRGELEAARDLLKRVVAKNPKHVGAQSFLVRLVLQTEGSNHGAGQLQQALSSVKPENRPALAITAQLVGAMMIDEGEVAGGLVHLEMAEALAGDDGAELAISTRRNVESDPRISPWLRNPYELSAVPEGLDASRQKRFEQAINWADQGLWSLAAAAFDTLSAEGTPEADRNLGLCRLWLADDAGAVEALRRHTRWVGPTPDNVDLEALCQIVAPEGEDERVELLQWIWPIRDRDGLLKALGQDRSLHAEGTARLDPNDPESFEAEQFLILDRPEPSREDLKEPADLARIQGRLLVGQDVVALEAFDDGRLDRLAARFRDRAGETITPAHPRTKVLGVENRASLALRTEWLVPDGLEPEQAERFNRLERQRVLTDVWPETPMSYLGGRTPRQAAKDGDAQLALRAALCQLELGHEFFKEGVDFPALRASLGVDPEPEIDPETVDIGAVHLARLHRIPAARLDDDKLVELFSRTHYYLLPQAMEQAALALVDRPALLQNGRVPRYTVFADLAHLASSRRAFKEAFEWLEKGRNSDPPSVRAANAPKWDMLEVRLLARTEKPETWVPQLAIVLERYHGSSEASATIMNGLVEMGLIQIVPNPDEPGEAMLDTRTLQTILTRYGPKITTSSGQLGVSATRGTIWTPGTEAGAGAGSALWTPGSAAPTPPSGAEKPKLIIPGR